MRSRHTYFRGHRWCLVGLPLPLALCGLPGIAHAARGPDAWTPPDEIITAQALSKVLAGNQGYAIAAGVFVLLVLLAIANRVPLIRAPRWQILGFALVPLVAAFGTMAAMSRPIEPRLQELTYEEIQKVIDSELAPAEPKQLAEKVLKWQGEIEGRSFLIDVSTMPVTATFGASAALVALLWLLTHHRVLRAS